MFLVSLCFFNVFGHLIVYITPNQQMAQVSRQQGGAATRVVRHADERCAQPQGTAHALFNSPLPRALTESLPTTHPPTPPPRLRWWRAAWPSS
jgi:hypothetical protein